MILKFFRRQVPSDPVSRYDRFGSDELSKSRLHETLQKFVEHELGWGDAISPAPLVWVKNNDEQIHPIFGLQKMKGGVAWPLFGLSVDFIPVIDRGIPKLRPIAKEAKFDILIDGRDRKYEIDFSHGPTCAIEDTVRKLPDFLTIAQAFWKAHTDISALPDAVQFMQNHTTRISGLAYENYMQSDLARPFLLAAAGMEEEAKHFWEQFVAKSETKMIQSLAPLFTQVLPNTRPT